MRGRFDEPERALSEGRIVRALEEFAGDLEAGIPIESRYTGGILAAVDAPGPGERPR